MAAIEDQLGRVVGGRYRLVAPLGVGASAQVYLADDVTLHRQVAVKMLQPALAGDQTFLDRFRAEARNVASVNHPNIVVVHDSGVDGVPYLVTEFLAGGSLRGMLVAGHRLTPSQALVAGLDACRGLAHAHGRGLVHRDLKPANVLFGDDGRLRIADFGVARALAESGLTDHEGALVGTARYAAPEQLLGQSTGPKADVYALALVLVESVTGRTPFASPDPRAALWARTAGDLEVPDELGALRAAIERAGRLDAAERTDAEEFGIALLAASERLDAPAPLPMVGALAEAGTDAPGDRTQFGPPGPHADQSAVGAAVGVVGAPGVSGRGGTTGRDGSGRAGSETGHASSGPASSGPGTTAEPGTTDPTGEPGDGGARRRWPLVVLAVVVAAVLGVIGFVATEDLRTPSGEVPELVGRRIDELELVAADHEWVLDEKKTRRNGTETGEIVATDPAPGERLEDGGTLVVLVSEGNELTDRPVDLVGRPVAEVVVDLERAGLRHRVEEIHDEDVAAGLVIGTVGEVPTQLPEGEIVPLSVSLGPAPRTIPDIPNAAGWGVMAEKLRDLRLEPVREDVFSDDVLKGRVMALDPGPGVEVERGTEIVVRVSKGPDLVAVPDTRGMKLDEASDALARAGLVLGQDCCSSKGRVVGSDPPPGQAVRRGSAVNLFLAR